MTSKEYLLQIKQIRTRIKLIKQTIEQLETEAGSLKAIDYAKDKIQSSPSNKVEDLLIKAVEARNKLIAETETYMSLLVEITRQIETLESSEHSILLYKRYVEDKSLEQIAVDMQYSYDRIRHMHGWALQDFLHTYPEISRL